MQFSLAITRLPGRDFDHGITSADLGAPDYQRMLAQHQAYVRTLEDLGLETVTLDPLPGYPDAHFVEDTAVVFPEAAVITRPGAAARLEETPAIEPILARYRTTIHIVRPGTVDGGDVFQDGQHFFIGVSDRTNQAGAEQLGQILEHHGYSWTAVPVAAGLHLKSSINLVGDHTLLSTRAFADLEEFRGYHMIVLEPGEDYAANTLLVNDHLITPSGFPGVVDKLMSLGRHIIELDVSEARKMDGGLSCLSLRLSS